MCLRRGNAPGGGGLPPAEDLFATGVVPRLRIEIPAEGMEVLRRYRQMRGQPRPER